jgi:membrane protease YdiL (CAAX protease family)
MTTPAMQTKLSLEQPGWTNRLERPLLFAADLLSGWIVFVVFSHFYPFFSGSADAAGRIAAGGVLLALAWLARSSDRYRKYWLLPFAFFTALAAISADFYLRDRWLLNALGLSDASPAGQAVDKLASSLVGISVALVLNRLAGQRLDALSIRRGNLRLGLAVGFAAFVVMIAAVIPVTEMFFQGRDLTWTRILAWSPWVLIFVLANAANEELLFRGLFLRRLSPILSGLAANLVTTIPFVVMHSFTTYATDQAVFLALQLLPLSLAWGWLMQRSKSIWGSVLFHAAMDIPIAVGIFSNL